MIAKIFHTGTQKANRIPEQNRTKEPPRPMRSAAQEICVTDTLKYERESASVCGTDGQRRYEAVAKLIRQQSESAADNLRSLTETFIRAQGNASASADAPYETDAYRCALAKQLVSEHGPLGVNAVSNRIAGLAIALSGGDADKLDELRGAIDKGFERAKQSFGGKLPDLCHDTYDEVMRKLDEWEAEAHALSACE